MTCAYCNADFCWLCGRHLSGQDAVQRHYASWNICGCPGLQMQEHLSRCPTYCLTPCVCCLRQVLSAASRSLQLVRIFIPLIHLLAFMLLPVAWICWPFIWFAPGLGTSRETCDEVWFLLLSPWSLAYALLRCCNFQPPCSPGRALADCWNMAFSRHCELDCCDSD